MIQQVLPRIYHIHVPLPGNPLKELNSYLIKGDGRNLLIDTGFRQEPCYAALKSALDELGVHREETDVLLTHFHADHAGLADLFCSPGTNIYASACECPVLDGTILDEYCQSQDLRYAMEGFSQEEAIALEQQNPARAMSLPPESHPYTPLNDEDTLDIGGYCLKAILTPGHTPGHLCFWMEEYGAMFLGDHVLFDITPNITFWPDMSNALGSYLESLKAIRAYDVELPLPAHRAPGNFKNRVDQLLLHHDQRLNEALTIIRSHPGLTAYEITSRMTWSIRCNSWADFPLPQKWFALGECLSHLDHLLILREICAETRNGLRYYYPA